MNCFFAAPLSKPSPPTFTILSTTSDGFEVEVIPAPDDFKVTSLNFDAISEEKFKEKGSKWLGTINLFGNYAKGS